MGGIKTCGKAVKKVRWQGFEEGELSRVAVRRNWKTLRIEKKDANGNEDRKCDGPESSGKP